jgi:hypothetical protein
MMLSEEIQKELNEIALQVNKSKEEILKESLRIYKEFLKLQKEFEMWDEISDIDFLNFEERIKNGNISCRNTKD